MSKVLVRKQEGGTPSVLMGGGQSGGGLGNIMYNLPQWVAPEEAVYGRFSEPDKEGNVTQISPGAMNRYMDDGTATAEQGKHAEKWARGLGRAGMAAGAGLGGLSALYNWTSSGEPLDLSGMANIGTAAYTGGRTAQPYSTTLGARVGVRAGKGMGAAHDNTTQVAEPTHLDSSNTPIRQLTAGDAGHNTIDMQYNPHTGRHEQMTEMSWDEGYGAEEPPFMQTLRDRQQEPPFMGSLRRWDTG
jgi:hypothetical protein